MPWTYCDNCKAAMSMPSIREIIYEEDIQCPVCGIYNDVADHNKEALVLILEGFEERIKNLEESAKELEKYKHYHRGIE